MDDAARGQLEHSAAGVYERFFVPALFRVPAQYVAHTVQPRDGGQILDVACGTGVLTRELAKAAGTPAVCTGVDCNESMLAVARTVAPEICWQHATAEALPFDDRAFANSYCNFGLMFFADRIEALREMRRVTDANGTICVAVWDSLARTPGYAAMCRLLERLFGSQVSAALEAPFVLGETGELRALFADAGIIEADIQSIDVTVRFPSLDEWVRTDVRGWTLSSMIDDAQFERLRLAANAELTEFVQSDGSVAFSSPMHVVTSRF